jgi:hypothetical protein
MFWDSSDGIEEYTTLPTSSVRTYANQKPWITGNIRAEQKSKAAAFKETLIRMLIINPAMPSDEPSNRQSINTGLRLNPTTLALTLFGCGKACELLRITKGNPTMSCPVAKAYQTS